MKREKECLIFLHSFTPMTFTTSLPWVGLWGRIWVTLTKDDVVPSWCKFPANGTRTDRHLLEQQACAMTKGHTKCPWSSRCNFGAATMENSLEVPQKTNNTATI